MFFVNQSKIYLALNIQLVECSNPQLLYILHTRAWVKLW